MPGPHRSVVIVALAYVHVLGCARPAPGDGPVVVFAAASLTRPLRAAIDSFVARGGASAGTVTLESQASLELARRVTELGQTPDVLVLADPQVFTSLLMPRHVARYTVFARNRMVLAYTPRSRGAAGIARAPQWWETLEQPGVEVGRADPSTDPSGYRTLLVFQLAERHYRVPGLAARLLAAAPPRNVRPREADQIALLEAGALDYVWTYESLARAAGLPFVTLPPEVDLGDPTRGAAYSAAAVRVAGHSLGDSITVRGAPIVYALAVPVAAPHRARGEAFVSYLLSVDGRRVLRRSALDALDTPLIVGTAEP